MQTIYYAHCKSIYDTPQEERDVEMLRLMGFEVINPNDPAHEEAAFRYGEQVMDYFCGIVEECDNLAFRAIPGGDIPAGVAKEIRVAREIGIPVIELPSFIPWREMDVDDTRQYLAEVGQR